MPFFDSAYAVSERPVRLVDVDPDLIAGMGAQSALAQLTLTTRRLQAGRWTSAESAGEGVHALLVFEGVLVRTVRVGHQCRSELLGDGDLICPFDREQAVATVDYTVEWEVLEPARLGVLDDAFFSTASRWPQIITALTLRGVRRSQRLALQLAIADLRRIDDRMITLLLHLGDRWGRMTPDGIHIPLRLTHDLIAQLLGAQRPTVTTSLNDLQRAGRLLRRSDRTWVVRASAGAPESVA
jgi:CRP/FNR family transcriptional regulator, cyclic AMP receptor protein